MAHHINEIIKLPMEDEKIIELYWRRDESAIRETDRKYRKYLFSIAYNIVHDKLDCEECLNDTYIGVWNAIPPSKPRVLKAFLTVIMRRTAIKRYHRKARQSAVPSEMTVSLTEIEAFLSENNEIDEEVDTKKLGNIINEFVYSLSDRRRFIFISRYYMSESIDTISYELSLSRSTVNKELVAIRNALREKLESEDYSV